MTKLFDQYLEEYQLLDRDDRYMMLIELGQKLPPMADELKNDRTLVRGCSAKVWLYALKSGQDQLEFIADSNAAITKGIVALIIELVQGKSATEILALDLMAALSPFDLSNQLSSNRTQGIPNMIGLIKDTALRLKP